MERNTDEVVEDSYGGDWDDMTAEVRDLGKSMGCTPADLSAKAQRSLFVRTGDKRWCAPFESPTAIYPG